MSTGAHAIGDAFRFIQHGDCDVIVAGGTEANLNKYGMSGFMKMRALSCKYNDQPSFFYESNPNFRLDTKLFRASNTIFGI